MKGIPESYRLYLMFLICLRLYDFNLMGTRKVLGFVFFLIFMFGMLLLGYIFNIADTQCVHEAEIEPML